MPVLGRYAETTARVVLYAYSYVLLEWLFLVTKPSFLGAWPVNERIQSLLVGVIPFLALALALHLSLCLASAVLPDSRRWRHGKDLLPRATPAMIAAAIVLMLVDNFTYTVFGWGIVKTSAFTAPIYWLLFLLVAVLHIRRTPGRHRYKPIAAGVAMAVSAIALAWALHGPGNVDADVYRSARADGRLPNIILFAADGVTANRTSAYGYARKTTPYLDTYLDRAMVAQNAFTNSGWTTSSLTSMLTGKYPATTKVLYPPFTLQGRDAYQSLPRILHGLGYRNLQETLRYYADGPDLNWKDSFDSANGRDIAPSPLDGAPLALQAPLLLVRRLHDRLTGRIRQLLLIGRMQDPHAQVAANEAPGRVYGVPDSERMARVADFAKRTRQPFFIHIHLMGTHCCNYHPQQRVFQERSAAAGPADKNAGLDDAILDSDRQFGQMMRLLDQRGLLDNTLVVYTSDHDNGWDFRSQVPLIFLFPHGEHHGRIVATTQLLDVAPTILDYLQVKVPDWMEGQSLLRGKLDPLRPVFSIFRLDRTRFAASDGDTLARVDDMGPPTYGLTRIGMVVCQRWYVMQIPDGKIRYGTIDGYRDECPPSRLPNGKQARAMLSRHLHDRGFTF